MDRTPYVKWPVYGLAAALTAVALFGCKGGGPSKPGRPAGVGAPEEAVGTPGAPTAADSLWQVALAAQAWPNTFAASYQLSFAGTQDGAAVKGSQRLSGQLRWSADSVLWLTAGMFGLEAFRMWVAHDSLVIVNRLEGVVDLYALSAWRERLPLALPEVAAADWLLAAVLLGLIPDVLQTAEPVYVERLPAAEGGAEVLRFGLLPAAGIPAAWAGLMVCELDTADYRLTGLYWLPAETMGFARPLETVGEALPAAAAASLDAAPMRLLYPSSDSRRLSWRNAAGKGMEVQITYSKIKRNEPVEVSTDLPKKYTVRYAE